MILINRIGFWCGVMAFAATLCYCIVQVMQLYGQLTYPADEILIYGSSLCIVVPFLGITLSLHHVSPANKKFWSHATVLFSTLYAVFVTANYVVQLGTVIPATMN